MEASLNTQLTNLEESKKDFILKLNENFVQERNNLKLKIENEKIEKKEEIEAKIRVLILIK